MIAMQALTVGVDSFYPATGRTTTNWLCEHHALSGYGSGKENGNWVCRCWSIKNRSLVRKYLWGLACNVVYLFPPPENMGSTSDFSLSYTAFHGMAVWSA